MAPPSLPFSQVSLGSHGHRSPRPWCFGALPCVEAKRLLHSGICWVSCGLRLSLCLVGEQGDSRKVLVVVSCVLYVPLNPLDRNRHLLFQSSGVGTSSLGTRRWRTYAGQPCSSRPGSPKCWKLLPVRQPLR